MRKTRPQASSIENTNRRRRFDAVTAPGILNALPENLVQCMSSPCLWSKQLQTEKHYRHSYRTAVVTDL